MLFSFGGCATLNFVGDADRKSMPTYSARTFFETTTVWGASFSHDESHVLTTSDASGVFNAYAQPLSGGDPSRISPLFHASNIVRPLLVVQGANDPRVLQVESDELVEKVRQNGVPVEYVVFPDEGHGFRKRENRITASEAYVKFLDTHLRR